MELLITRLPQDLRAHLIQKIAKFVTGVTLPSVAAETSIMCCIPSNVAPEDTCKYLVEPILASLEAEVPGLQAAAAADSDFNLSKVSCGICMQFMSARTKKNLRPQTPPVNYDMRVVSSCASCGCTCIIMS